MKLRAFLSSLVIATALFVSGVALAADEAKNVPYADIRFTKEMWGTEFLKSLDEGPRYLLANEELTISEPPANDSTETKAELDKLREFEKSARTDDVVATIKEEHIGDIFLIMAKNGSNPDALIQNGDIEKAVRAASIDVGYFVLREKMKYLRARPFQLAPEITTVIETPAHSAYPSGHAAQSYAAALVLGMIDTANADKYKEAAYAIGERREIAGVHYPSDTKAGQELAGQVVEKLLKNKDYAAKLQKAKDSFVAPKP